MKTRFFLAAICVAAMLTACKGKPGETPVQGTDTTKTEVQTPEPEVQPVVEQTDYAQEVLKLIPRNLMSERINDSIYNEATQTKRVFDEYTNPNNISCMNGEGGIYNIVYVNCYHMQNEEDGIFVLYYTEAGVDGAVTDIMKTYIYKDGALTEIENPIKAPAFDEFFEGVDVPADLKSAVKEMKREYDREKGSLRGIDLRHKQDNSNILELRPSYIADDRLWDLANPICYEFNGNTFVKMQR
ncbi:MAG: hypothetical protein IJK74_06800 [Bacteroidales bacterium]|nr:hypothetical protein [Bacteroidales bacterium]